MCLVLSKHLKCIIPFNPYQSLRELLFYISFVQVKKKKMRFKEFKDYTTNKWYNSDSNTDLPDCRGCVLEICFHMLK